jgi:hypothetical protein
MKVTDASANTETGYDKSSTAQALELWSSGHRPDVTPSHTLANGPTDKSC